jgi:hypothetical protein
VKLEGLGSAFHFQNSARQNSERIAYARAVCAACSFFVYIEACPYCAREHIHDQTRYDTSIDPWPVLKRDGGVRKARCSTGTEHRLYRVVVDGPPLFTASGACRPQAFQVMAAFAEREFLPIIDRCWIPRSSALRRWEDA